MTTLFVLIALLALLTIASKMSLHRLPTMGVYAALLALSVWATHDWAIHSPRTITDHLLSDPLPRQYSTILATVEVAIALLLAFARERQVSPRSTFLQRMAATFSRWIVLGSRYYLTLLSIPVLYLIQVEFVYAFPGRDFSLSLLLTLLLILAVTLLGWALRWGLPRLQTRVELHLIVTLSLCASLLASTVTGTLTYLPSATSRDYTDPYLPYYVLLLSLPILIGFTYSLLSKKWK